MSKFVADHLTDALLNQLSIDKAIERSGRAVVITTVDEHGWPHPAMLSSLEMVARDSRNIRLALHAGSRTARNMQTNGKLTMVIADVAGVFYVKGDILLVAPSLSAAPELAKFNFRVDSVLEDNPADYEKAHLTSGIRVERDALDPIKSESILRELLAD